MKILFADMAKMLVVLVLMMMLGCGDAAPLSLKDWAGKPKVRIELFGGTSAKLFKDLKAKQDQGSILATFVLQKPTTCKDIGFAYTSSEHSTFEGTAKQARDRNANNPVEDWLNAILDVSKLLGTVNFDQKLFYAAQSTCVENTPNHKGSRGDGHYALITPKSTL